MHGFIGKKISYLRSSVQPHLPIPITDVRSRGEKISQRSPLGTPGCRGSFVDTLVPIGPYDPETDTLTPDRS